MTDKRQLSKESKEFLENLRLYLFSSGKQEVEINEIVEELEAHLCEAEQNGKPIEKIVGQSPQQYMEMLSQELTVDHRSWIKYIILIIAGSFSFKIFSDLLEGSLTYSVLEIVGHIVISLIFLVSLFAGFKWIAAKNFSTKKQALLLFGISTLPITLFVGLIFLNRAVATPLIHFGQIGSLLIGAAFALLIIGFSIWAKTWLLIIITGLLVLPDYLLRLTTLNMETQLFVSSIITYGGILLYLLISSRLAKN